MIPPLLVVYLTLLFGCSVTGIICTRRLKWTSSPIRLLPWFIMLTFISEMIAIYLMIKYNNNHPVYNIYQIIQFVFYSYTLTCMIENRKAGKLLIGLSIPFTLFAIINISFIKGIGQMNTINFFIGAVIIAFFSGYSLSELFKKAVAESPFRMPAFWVSSGLLILNSCLVPLVLPATFGMHFTFGEARIIFILVMLVNYISYCMFTTAFWYLYKNNERSSA